MPTLLLPYTNISFWNCSFKMANLQKPSPSGRGLGEGLKIWRNCDSHPALSQKERVL